MNDLPSQLTLVRRWFTDKSTVGILSFLGKQECHVLEDTSRKEKIPGKTAIPFGIYEVVINFSNRFQTYLPLLLNVPNYTGIRIHAGNRPEDTEGCLLVGTYDENVPDTVGSSRIALKNLMEKLEPMVRKEKVFIEIRGGYGSYPVA